MKLHNPVKDFVPRLYPQGDVTQWFGENKQLYASVCSPSGCLTGGHNGIDIVRPWGTPILAVHGGKIVEVLEKDNGYGKHVKIISAEGFEWVYGHLSKIQVTLGQQVTAGQQIGLMGNTGFVVSGATPFWQNNPFAGTHLHLGRRKFRAYTGSGTWNITYSSGDKGTIEGYNNGFLGAVPIIAEDFDDQPTGAIDQSLTYQSLLNVAADLDKQGKTQQANIVRAVAGIIRAFS